MVVANLVGQDGTGFESDENEAVLVLRTGETIPLAPRSQARNRRPHLRPGNEAPPGPPRGPMTKDEVRNRLLQFYQDLGVKTIYRRDSPETSHQAPATAEPSAPEPLAPLGRRRA